MSDKRIGFRRRLLLLSLVLCGGVLASWSIGAMATRGVPMPPAATPPPTVAPTPAPSPSPTPAPTPTPFPAFDFAQSAPQVVAAPEDYFNDAVFLGDSRTDGLKLYSGIRGADFLSYKALMVFQITGTHGVKEKKIAVGDTKKTVLQALEDKQYGKVYLMFGINELGWNRDTDFGEAYRILIDEVRKRQPDAVIYIESLIPVNPEKCKASKASYYITNETIAAYNEILKEVAAEKGAVYLDLASALSDENGVLPKEATVDGIHFVKSYYGKWLDYLKIHTVSHEAFQAGQPTAETEAALDA